MRPGTRIEANGLDLHVVDEGRGTPVLLLHGFPDSSQLWRHQIPALVDAGFRAIAPDLRGFGESDRPAATEAYALPLVLGDVSALAQQLGVERLHVVAHDWGAAVAWMLSSAFPNLVDRLVVLSVGHPASFAEPSIEQRERSWYMLFFQFEGVAEEALVRDDWKLFREFTRNHPETDSWIRDLSRPGALRAGLSWYRANVRPQPPPAERPVFPKVQAPTLGIWSRGDAYLTEAQMLGSAAQMAGPWRYERLEDASHWIPLDQPERLNKLVIDFLGASPPQGG